MSSTDLHLPAALSLFAFLGLLMVCVHGAVGLPGLAHIQVQVGVAPGASVQVLVSQLHIVPGHLCTCAAHNG